MSEESNPAGSSSLSGATALITGSTRGLGRTTAERLLARGANLILSGRDQQAVDAAVDELSGHGPHVLGFAADLSNLASTHALAQNAMSAFGRIDILVNNAGMSRRGHFWDVTDADWDEQVNVNLRSPFILAQHVARRMIERGTRGRIVNVGTIGARKCHRDGCIYDSAKGGVEVMTRNMAFELAPYGISVNCVVPGAIPIRPGGTFDPEASGQYLQFVPVGRFGSSEDIAAAVLYFCELGTEFTTGQSLLVDGGHAAYLYE